MVGWTLSSQIVVGLSLAVVLSSGCVSRIDRFAVENAVLHTADSPLLENANEADWFSDGGTTVIANAQTMDRGGRTVISRRSFDQGPLLVASDVHPTRLHVACSIRWSDVYRFREDEYEEFEVAFARRANDSLVEPEASLVAGSVLSVRAG
jgi:hypothetical protein